MPVILKLAVHILLGLGQLPFGDIGEKLVRRPGIDILEGKPGAVLRGSGVGDIGSELGSVQPVAPDFRHHLPVAQFAYKRRNRLAGSHCKQDDYGYT